MINKKQEKYCQVMVVLVCVFLLNACENGIVGTGDKPTILGIAQKGPFEAGSDITIVSHFGENYAQSDSYQRKTLDDIGNFEFTFQKDTLYDIAVTGKHFNEISGQMSADSMTLNSTYYHEEDGKSFVSINILTHLIHSRIKHLLDEDRKKPIADRVGPHLLTKQAREELQVELRQDIFAEHLSDFSFSNMTVYDLENTDTTANAILLFISSAFYQLSSSSDGGVSMEKMLAEIASDFELDGKIDGVADQGTSALSGVVYVSSLDDAARQLNPDVIRENLSLYSIKTTGSKIPVPDISFLVDNDGDKKTNDVDTDDDGDGMLDELDLYPYRFDIILQSQTFSTSQDVSIQLSLQYNTPEDAVNNKVYPSNIVGPSDGRLDSSSLIYTPNPGFTGVDHISINVACTLCPAIGYRPYESNEAIITINVLAQ